MHACCEGAHEECLILAPIEHPLAYIWIFEHDVHDWLSLKCDHQLQ